MQQLFEVVPREQVLLLRYRDLREAPVQTLDAIFDFLDAGHAAQRSSLRLAGKIGTGYQSIDDPFGDRAAERTRRRRS